MPGSIRLDEIFAVAPVAERLNGSLDDKTLDMWRQARGELLGFALHLERNQSGLTANQIRMAVKLADDTCVRQAVTNSAKETS